MLREGALDAPQQGRIVSFSQVLEPLQGFLEAAGGKVLGRADQRGRYRGGGMPGCPRKRQCTLAAVLPPEDLQQECLADDVRRDGRNARVLRKGLPKIRHELARPTG